MAIVNEVITKFSFAGSLSPLGKFNTGSAAIVKSLGMISAASIAATAAVSAFVLKTTGGLDSMIQLSRTTGVAINKIQELGFVASVSGSNLQAVMGTMESLSEKIGEAAWMGNEEFARLGISVRGSNGEIKKADEVLRDIQSRFRAMGLSRQEQISFAQKLGIDKTLIQLMNRSGKEMDTLTSRARKLGVLTKKEADAAASLNDSMTMLKFGLSAISNQIAVGLAPHMQQFSDMITNLLGDNKELISEGIGKGIVFFKAFGRAIVDLAPIVAGLLGGLALIGIALSPTAAIAVGIGAALLAIQDLMVAFRGGDSAIQKFIETYTGIDVTPGLKKLIEWVKKLSEYMVKITDTITTVSGRGFEKRIGDIKADIVSEEKPGWYQSLNRFLRSGMVGFENRQTQPGATSIDQTNNIDIHISDAQPGAWERVRDEISDVVTFNSRGGK